MFGSEVYVHIPKETRKKWNMKGYRIYIPEKGKIGIYRDVIFKTDAATERRTSVDEEDPTLSDTELVEANDERVQESEEDEEGNETENSYESITQEDEHQNVQEIEEQQENQSQEPGRNLREREK